MMAKKYRNAGFLPIDGMQKLIESLGGEVQAAKKAIESSLFFHPEIICAQHAEMKDTLSKKNSLPARRGEQGKVEIYLHPAIFPAQSRKMVMATQMCVA